MYLEEFILLTEDQEDIMCEGMREIFNNIYPLRIFCRKGLRKINFENITIFYGGNGSGKTTLLNIIASRLRADRKSINKMSEIFDKYVRNTHGTMYNIKECKEIKFIASDDIFDYLLDTRAINSGVNRKKEELAEEYNYYKYGNKSVRNALDDYEELKKQNAARFGSGTKFIRGFLGNNNLIQRSNGESALEFWQKEIKDHAIYLLDEPENSLSAENILKLKQFIEDSARFYNCQFIISTHSPFLLALREAKIYDLDQVPVSTKAWNELDNMKIYYDFFKEHENLFCKL